MALNYSFYTHTCSMLHAVRKGIPGLQANEFFLSSLTADTDECAEGLSSCGAHAQCVNLPGSHRCQCQSGYELGFDGRTCVGE